jgi:TPR repeat protein
LNEAAKYYKLAADQNYAVAQFNSLVCLEHGQGVEVDFKAAAKYFTSVADQNIVPAQFKYASSLQEGRGTAVDLLRSAQYHRRAADSAVLSEITLWVNITMAFVLRMAAVSALI